MTLFVKSKTEEPDRLEQAFGGPEQSLWRAESLLELAVILGQQNAFHEILCVVSSKARALVDADIVSIVMVNPRTQETAKTLTREGKEADPKRLHLLRTNVEGWVMKNRTQFLSSDIRADPRSAKHLFEETPVRSVMCMQLQSERTISGHIIVMNQENSAEFDVQGSSAPGEAGGYVCHLSQ